MDNVTKIANEFSFIIKSWLSEDQLRQVNEINEKEGGNYCDTHEFCDANIAMGLAFKRVTGKGIDIQSEAACEVWDKAWTMAKNNKFEPIKYKMAKQLTYLKTGVASAKSDFLAHVHELVHIPLTAKTTYGQLLDAVDEHFITVDDIAAAKEWTDMQRDGMQESFFNVEVLDITPEPGIKIFAIFDLKTL